jgi:hypothetical protein
MKTSFREDKLYHKAQAVGSSCDPDRLLPEASWQFAMKRWLKIGFALLIGIPLVLISAWTILIYWGLSRPYQPAHYGPPMLSAEPPGEVRAVLRHSDAFQTFRTVSSIPQFVRDSLVRERSDGQVLMAEPGGAWEVTDAITYPSLPRLRLFSVALSHDYCFLFYEGGGFGDYFALSVFRIQSKTLIWREYPFPAVTDLADLQVALLLFDKVSPPHALIPKR